MDCFTVLADHDLDHTDHLYIKPALVRGYAGSVQYRSNPGSMPYEDHEDHADYTAATRQHELDHTDHTDHTGQECIRPCLADLHHEL